MSYGAVPAWNNPVGATLVVARPTLVVARFGDPQPRGYGTGQARPLRSLFFACSQTGAPGRKLV